MCVCVFAVCSVPVKQFAPASTECQLASKLQQHSSQRDMHSSVRCRLCRQSHSGLYLQRAVCHQRNGLLCAGW